MLASEISLGTRHNMEDGTPVKYAFRVSTLEITEAISSSKRKTIFSDEKEESTGDAEQRQRVCLFLDQLMSLLCFLLDLRTIPPPLLRDIKQSLLQLANFYSTSLSNRHRDPEKDGGRPLQARIGLCYLHRNKGSKSDEIKVAYSPRGNFNLRDFHHAVINIPTDNYIRVSCDVDMPGSSNLDIEFMKLLKNDELYPWCDKYALKKLIFISSYLVTVDEDLRKILMEAAEQCVSVEFVMLEQDHYHDLPDRSESFLNSISDLENCLLRRYIPNFGVLCGLVKRWLQDLYDDTLHAVFIFDEEIGGFNNKLYCSLHASSCQIIDNFIPCQTCSCHGHPIRKSTLVKSKKLCCPVTKCAIEASQETKNAVEVGDNTVLFLPSFHEHLKQQIISLPASFNVLERINLASLDEGMILGTPYVVIPGTGNENDAVSEECSGSETNFCFFHGLRATLSSMDQGLLCASRYNTETMKDTIFDCYYILQPSDSGPMLLRRVAALEEILPVPVAMILDDIMVSEDTITSVRASILKIKVADYDPLLHERAFHTKLNLLVKESLQFGAIRENIVNFGHRHRGPPGLEDSMLTQSSTHQIPDIEMKPSEDWIEDDMSSMTAEWEQLLVVDNVKDNLSPQAFSRSLVENKILSSQSKPVTEKTSRILERLEHPKQCTLTQASQNIATGRLKKPLFSISSTSSNQAMKPSFQRLKRKQITS